MLEFRSVEHFNRNYNTITRSTGRRTNIATAPVFTRLERDVAVR